MGVYVCVSVGTEKSGGRGWWCCQCVCVCVGGVQYIYHGCRERSVSPTLAPGLAQRKPLSVSLGRVCVRVCVMGGATM